MSSRNDYKREKIGVPLLFWNILEYLFMRILTK